MIGSISKIRPCGHSSHYKYNHCKSITEITRISRDYKNDVDGDGMWDKNLNNLTNASKLFYVANRIKKIKLHLPKCTNVSSLCESAYNITDVFLDAPNATNATYCFLWASRNNLIKSFEINLPKSTTGEGFLMGSSIECAKLPSKNWTNITSIFQSNNSRVRQMECNFENVILAKNAWNPMDSSGTYIVSEMKYPIDVNGECIYDSKLPQHYIDGVAQYKYVTFPKLKSGQDAFPHTRLNKQSALSILNSLPSWSDGRENHPFRLGIHTDLKYDPDVNIALKKCQNTFITPIEEFGSTLPETVTEDKGWTLTINWNGVKSANAYPPQSTVEDI